MKKILYISIISWALTVPSACNDFLDELPDNRTVVDSSDKITKLLVSAYPKTNHNLVPELASDNIADNGELNPNYNEFYKQASYWEDIKESNNDGIDNIWEGCYEAIASSNQALQAIKELGEDGLGPQKGEALITRAYAHFVLVNIFAKHFNKETSETDLGVVYMEEPETKLKPSYKRESVASVYTKIERDIEEALPLIDDNLYGVAQYHFTKAVAYAFAARFYLYSEQWEKAEKYATLALGQTPKLRKWKEIGDLPKKENIVTNAYIDNEANLLTEVSTSLAGLVFGAFRIGARFNHTRFLNEGQTMLASTPWNPNGTLSVEAYYFTPFVYSGNNLDKSLFYKIPYLFEYTDPVTQTGYPKTVSVIFSTDETLLTRAEARILQKKYDEAIADINLYTANIYKGNKTTTIEKVNEFYGGMPYSNSGGVNTVNQKKRLHPKFIIEEGGTQENLIHYVLQCRRILTLHEGLRWYDLKRYGIEVERIVYDHLGEPSQVITLPADDPRRAIQLPQDVIKAGLEPNPR